MKKLYVILILFVFTLVVIPLGVFGEMECEHQNLLHTTRYDYVQTASLSDHLKIPIYTLYCTDCGLRFPDSSWEGNSVPEAHDPVESQSTIGIKKNSTYHWAEIKKITSCSLCNKQLNSVIMDGTVEAHYTNNPMDWIDGGHSGSYHLYYQYCSKNGCSQYYLWRIILCPGGGEHIGPTSILSPEVTE